jgi:hypothetical protein
MLLFYCVIASRSIRIEDILVTVDLFLLAHNTHQVHVLVVDGSWTWSLSSHLSSSLVDTKRTKLRCVGVDSSKVAPPTFARNFSDTKFQLNNSVFINCSGTTNNGTANQWYQQWHPQAPPRYTIAAVITSL